MFPAASVSLPDVSLSRAEIASVRGRLQSYQARYAPFFGRRELRGHARAYLQGLLSDEPRKVHRAHGPAPAGGRRPHSGGAPGAGGGHAGRGGGVLATDGTDIPKDGTESGGGAQDCGQLPGGGLRGQPGTRGRGPGGPAAADTPFRSEPKLVAEDSLPLRWVTCDEGFSLSHAFLDGVAGLGLGYLAEVARRGREPGPDVWLLLRRNPATDELKCHLSNGPADRYGTGFGGGADAGFGPISTRLKQ